MKGQLEELKHRIGDEVFHLSKVNAETICFLDEHDVLPRAFSGVPQYYDRLFRALGSRDHNKRLLHGRTLMRDLWEVEIGLGPYPFSEVLAEFEFGRQFWSGYRDHVLHQLRVYLLGLYMFFGCRKIRELFGNLGTSDFIIQWKVAALTHDHGYLYETQGAELNQWVLEKVMPVFHDCVGFPLSTLSHNTKKNSIAGPADDDKQALFSLINKRGITRGREDEIQRFLKIIRPEIATIGDLGLFQGKDLFQFLETAGRVSQLGNPNVNPLRSYYEFACRYPPTPDTLRCRDHGVTSALFLLLQTEFLSYYYAVLDGALPGVWQALGLPQENITFIKAVSKLHRRYDVFFRKAASAVALHNVENKWTRSPELVRIAEKDFGLTLEDFRISPSADPLAFLLVLVDTLQDWDRPVFVPLSEDSGMGHHQDEQDISVILTDDKVCVAFSTQRSLEYDPYVALQTELYSRLAKSFVDDLLLRVSWTGIGVCKATRQAQSLPGPTPPMTTELGKLIIQAKKSDHFEYVSSIDTRLAFRTFLIVPASNFF